MIGPDRFLQGRTEQIAAIRLNRLGLATPTVYALLNGSQKAPKARLKFGAVELALPDHQDSPALGRKPALVFLVALHVSFKLLPPKCGTRFGHIPAAAPMPMPKTSMNEYYGSPASKDDIWTSRQFPLM